MQSGGTTGEAAHLVSMWCAPCHTRNFRDATAGPHTDGICGGGGDNGTMSWQAQTPQTPGVFGPDAADVHAKLKRVLANAAEERGKTVELPGGTAAAEGSLPLNLCGNEAEKRRICSLLNARTGDYPCGLLICDAMERDLPVVYANGYLEDATGYAQHEILGRPYNFAQRRGVYATAEHELVDRATSAELATALQMGLRWKGEIVSFKKDGTPMRTRTDWTPLHGDRLRPTRVTHWAAYLKLYPMHNTKDLDNCSAGSPPGLGSSDKSALQAMGNNGSGGERKPSLFEPGSIWARVASFLSMGMLGSRAGLGFLDLSVPLQTRILSELDVQSCLNVAATCRELHTLVNTAHGLWLELCIARVGLAATCDIGPYAARLGWMYVVRELHTLQAVGWDSIKVAGEVLPARINFSMCALGTKLLFFGGEAERGVALSDLHVVDLSHPTPFWQKLTLPKGAPQPAGRWGHSLRTVSDGRLVLFGGCGAHGALNDVHVLWLSAGEPPHWQSLPMPLCHAPRPRSWHGAASLSDRRLLVFGGCDAVGRMLNDTWILHLHPTAPYWQQLATGWAPPPRLGISLCVTPNRENRDSERVIMFGGLAAVGPLRLRSNDTFTISPNDPSPTWRFVCNTKEVGTGALGSYGEKQPAALPTPTPRMEQVMGVVAGDCAIMFGGSLGDSSARNRSPVSEPWVCRLNTATPMWRPLRIQDAGPPSLQQLAHTWGYSSTMMDYTHFAFLGARNGALVFDEVFTLSLLSPPPKLLAPLPLAMEALPPPTAYDDSPPLARAAKGKGKRQHSLEQQRCQVVERRRQQAERSPRGARGSGTPPHKRSDSGSNSGSNSSGAGSDESVKCRESVQYKRHAAATNLGAGWPTMARHSFHSGRSNNTCWASPLQSPSPRRQGSTPGSSGKDIGGSPGTTASPSNELVAEDIGSAGTSSDAPQSTRHPNLSERGTPSPPSGNSATPLEAPGDQQTPMTPPEPSEEDENMSSDGSYLSSQLV